MLDDGTFFDIEVKSNFPKISEVSLQRTRDQANAFYFYRFCSEWALQVLVNQAGRTEASFTKALEVQTPTTLKTSR